MPIRRIKRKDGIVQRYYVKNLKAFKEKYVYNKAEKVWVKKELPKIPEIPEIPLKPKTMYRLTICFNFVIHNNYYAFRYQVWALTREELEEKQQYYIERAMELAVEEQYSYEELWFVDDAQLGIGIQEVPYDEDLIGEEEWEVEYLGHKKDGWSAKRAREWIQEHLGKWLE